MTRVLILNGPNLNTLGMREPQLYGTATLADIEAMCRRTADSMQADVCFFQSNHEGELVEEIHRHAPWLNDKDAAQAIVFNAGAYTHTSIALRDALSAVGLPFVEVHISNVHAREEFRHHSMLADKASALVIGMGIDGYDYALQHLVKKIRKQETE